MLALQLFIECSKIWTNFTLIIFINLIIYYQYDRLSFFGTTRIALYFCILVPLHFYGM